MVSPLLTTEPLSGAELLEPTSSETGTGLVKPLLSGELWTSRIWMSPNSLAPKAALSIWNS